MHDYPRVEDNELWDIVLDGPFIPSAKVKDAEVTKFVPKTLQQYNEATERRSRKATYLRSS